MPLVTRLRGLFGNSVSETHAYQKQLAEPSNILATTLLLRAIEAGANAVCIGNRSDIVNLRKTTAENEKLCDEIRQLMAADRANAPESYSAMARGAIPSGVSDRPSFPISFRIDDSLQLFDHLPFRMYGNLLSAFKSRPVSLHTGNDGPQPLRFIEIGYPTAQPPYTTAPHGKRRFLEVDIEMDSSNCIWIHLRNIKECGDEVRASQSLF